MLVNVDGCLSVHHNPGPVIEELKSQHKLKNDTYGEPTRYLGENVEKYQVPLTGKTYWSIHTYDYVVELCKMVQKWSENYERKFKNNCDDAMKANYRPEIDTSDELGDGLASQYQQMISIFQ